MNVRFSVNRYLAERKMRGEFSKGTLDANRSTLHQFATNTGNPEIGQLRAAHIDKWFAAHQHDAPATRRSRFSQIHVFLDFAVRHEWLKQHPMLNYRAPKMPRYKPRSLTQDEASKVFLAATDERERVLVLLGLQEGLRCCEMCNLELADVDLHDRLLRVVGKGGHERYVPLSEQTARAIRAYLAVSPPVAGPLIRSYQTPTRALTPGRASDLLSRIFADAGIKTGPRDGRSAHALRHTAATAVLRNCNGNIKLVQQFLGHQSSQTTDRYTSQLLAVTELRDAADGREY